MADIHLLDFARSNNASHVGGIAQNLGLKWPPPPVLSVRDLARCSLQTEWANYPHTLALVPLLTCKPQSVEDIVAAIRNAEANGRQAHAFGSKWSFSDCAAGQDPTNLCLVDMTGLNQPLASLKPAMTAGDPSLAFHTQGGITIHDLYTRLDAFTDPATNQPRPLALETMGGASGQTLAGAVSTGTHGGDYLRGPLADSVLALHLVGAGGIQYWIEPTIGITDPSLLREFVIPAVEPQNIIYDDKTFNACLVSLGCMGVVYALVLRVRDQYNLTEDTIATTWSDFLSNALTFMNYPSSRFLQVALAPYPDANNETVCLVTTRSEGGDNLNACTQGDVNQAILDLILDLYSAAPGTVIVKALQALEDLIHGGALPSSVNDALVSLVNLILSEAPSLRSILTRDYASIMTAYWPPVICGGKSFCVMDTTRRTPGGNVEPPPPSPLFAYSIEMFFQARDAATGDLPWSRFVQAVIALVNAATNTFLTGYIGIRFMGSTRASLGMQQWNQTCSVEISTLGGVQGELALLTNILDLMYTFGGVPHWGQLIDLNVKGNGNLYPRLQEWRQIYGRLSNNFATRTFENSLSIRWQLTTP
jgi:hypothetical protein